MDRVVATVSDALVEERTFRADRGEVARARQFVVEATGARGRAADDLALVTSELATNAVLLARSPFVVRVAVSAGVARVQVRDDDGGSPRLRNGSTDDLDGRGISIISTVALRWGVEPDGAGKWVWADVGLDP